MSETLNLSPELSMRPPREVPTSPRHGLRRYFRYKKLLVLLCTCRSDILANLLRTLSVALADDPICLLRHLYNPSSNIEVLLACSAIKFHHVRMVSVNGENVVLAFLWRGMCS